MREGAGYRGGHNRGVGGPDQPPCRGGDGPAVRRSGRDRGRGARARRRELSIPAEILTKPGKLADVEFAIIRGHSLQGYDILKDIDFDWPIADIVLQHHERMDGSGYALPV